MLYPIRAYGDPILREKAAPVERVTKEIRDLARDMIETMRAEKGVGLAAQQVGRTEAVCVIEIPATYDVDEEGRRLHPDLDMPLVLVNPEITDFSKDTVSAEEGCLSFPEMAAPVQRSAKIVLMYTDLKEEKHTLQLQQFVARAIQHELDHLNGILLVDRMSVIKKIALGGQLKRLRRQTLAALDGE